MNKLCKDANVSISDYDRHFTQQELYDINKTSKENSRIIDTVLSSARGSNLSYIAKNQVIPQYDLNLVLETAKILGNISSLDNPTSISEDEHIDLSTEDIYDDTTWEAQQIRKFIYEKLCEIYSKPMLDLILNKMHPGNVRFMNPDVKDASSVPQNIFITNLKRDNKSDLNPNAKHYFLELTDMMNEILEANNLKLLKDKINLIGRKKFPIKSPNQNHQKVLLYFTSLYLLIEIYKFKFDNEITFEEIFPENLDKDSKKKNRKIYLKRIEDNWMKDVGFFDEDVVEVSFEKLLKLYDINKSDESILQKYMDEKRDLAKDKKKSKEEIRNNKIKIYKRIWTEIKLAFQYLPYNPENKINLIPLIENASNSFTIRSNEIELRNVRVSEATETKLEIDKFYHLKANNNNAIFKLELQEIKENTKTDGPKKKRITIIESYDYTFKIDNTKINIIELTEAFARFMVTGPQKKSILPTISIYSSDQDDREQKNSINMIYQFLTATSSFRNEEEFIEDILLNSPDIIFFKPYSHMFNLSSQKQGALYESQKDFIRKLKELVEDLFNNIVSKEIFDSKTQKKEILFHTGTMGSGKTSMITYCLPMIVKHYNKMLSPKLGGSKFVELKFGGSDSSGLGDNFTKVKSMIDKFCNMDSSTELSKQKSKQSKFIVPVMAVPSSEVIKSSVISCGNFYNTWIITSDKDDNVEINILDKASIKRSGNSISVNEYAAFRSFRGDVEKDDEEYNSAFHKQIKKILTAHTLLKKTDDQQWQEYWEDEQQIKFKAKIKELKYNFFKKLEAPLIEEGIKIWINDRKEAMFDKYYENRRIKWKKVADNVNPKQVNYNRLLEAMGLPKETRGPIRPSQEHWIKYYKYEFNQIWESKWDSKKDSEWIKYYKKAYHEYANDKKWNDTDDFKKFNPKEYMPYDEIKAQAHEKLCAYINDEKFLENFRWNIKDRTDWENKFKRLTNSKIFDENKRPDIIFCDPKSMKLLLKNQRFFSDGSKYFDNFELNWHFLPVIDEFPATGDCDQRILSLDDNEFVKTNIEIAQMPISHKIIMSASLLKDQVLESDIFSRLFNEIDFAKEEFTLSSITDLFEYERIDDNYRLTKVNPFHSLYLPEHKNVVKLWNQDVYRCFSTNDIIKCKNIYNSILSGETYEHKESDRFYSIDNSYNEDLFYSPDHLAESEYNKEIDDNSSSNLVKVMSEYDNINTYQVINTLNQGDCFFDSIRILINDQIVKANGENYTIKELRLLSLFDNVADTINYIESIRASKVVGEYHEYDTALFDKISVDDLDLLALIGTDPEGLTGSEMSMFIKRIRELMLHSDWWGDQITIKNLCSKLNIIPILFDATRGYAITAVPYIITDYTQQVRYVMLQYSGNHYQAIKMINDGNELTLLTFDQISDGLKQKAEVDLYNFGSNESQLNQFGQEFERISNTPLVNGPTTISKRKIDEKLPIFRRNAIERGIDYTVGGSIIQTQIELDDSLKPIIFTKDIYEKEANYLSFIKKLFNSIGNLNDEQFMSFLGGIKEYPDEGDDNWSYYFKELSANDYYEKVMKKKNTLHISTTNYCGNIRHILKNSSYYNDKDELISEPTSPAREYIDEYDITPYDSKESKFNLVELINTRALKYRRLFKKYLDEFNKQKKFKEIMKKYKENKLRDFLRIFNDSNGINNNWRKVTSKPSDVLTLNGETISSKRHIDQVSKDIPKIIKTLQAIEEATNDFIRVETEFGRVAIDQKDFFNLINNNGDDAAILLSGIGFDESEFNYIPISLRVKSKFSLHSIAKMFGKNYKDVENIYLYDINFEEGNTLQPFIGPESLVQALARSSRRKEIGEKVVQAFMPRGFGTLFKDFNTRTSLNEIDRYVRGKRIRKDEPIVTQPTTEPAPTLYAVEYSSTQPPLTQSSTQPPTTTYILNPSAEIFYPTESFELINNLRLTIDESDLPGEYKNKIKAVINRLLELNNYPSNKINSILTECADDIQRMDWLGFLSDNLKIRPVEKYEIHYTDDCKELLKNLEIKYPFKSLKKIKVDKRLLEKKDGIRGIDSIIDSIKDNIKNILTEAIEKKLKLPSL